MSLYGHWLDCTDTARQGSSLPRRFAVGAFYFAWGFRRDTVREARAAFLMGLTDRACRLWRVPTADREALMALMDDRLF